MKIKSNRPVLRTLTEHYRDGHTLFRFEPILVNYRSVDTRTGLRQKLKLCGGLPQRDLKFGGERLDFFSQVKPKKSTASRWLEPAVLRVGPNTGTGNLSSVPKNVPGGWRHADVIEGCSFCGQYPDVKRLCFDEWAALCFAGSEVNTGSGLAFPAQVGGESLNRNPCGLWFVWAKDSGPVWFLLVRPARK